MKKKNDLFVGASYKIDELTPVTITKKELNKREVKFFLNDVRGNRYVFMHCHNLYKWSARLQVWVLLMHSDAVYSVVKQKLSIRNHEVDRLYTMLSDMRFVALNII